MSAPLPADVPRSAPPPDADDLVVSFQPPPQVIEVEATSRALAPPALAPTPAPPPLRAAPLGIEALITAPPPQTESGARARLLGLLRDIGAEAQNLQPLLADLKKQATLLDPQTRAQQTAAALTMARKVFEPNEERIDILLLAVRTVLAEAPSLHDRYGGEVTHVENRWERIRLAWPPLSATVEQALVGVAEAEAHFDELIYHCCLVTIPPRVNQHLETLRVGQRLDFHDAFRDEVAKVEDRVRLLKYLSAHPTSVHGLVDTDAGVIYYVSPDGGRRLLSFAMVAAALLAGAGIAVVLARLGSWLGLAEWPVLPPRTGELLIAYLFLVLGAGAHIGVDVLKQSRSGTGTAPSALDDGLLWVHVKEVPIVAGIASLWVGILGLALLQPSVAWQTAFFVGYSIDSFVDLFLQRFGQFTTSRADKLRKELTSQPVP